MKRHRIVQSSGVIVFPQFPLLVMADTHTLIMNSVLLLPIEWQKWGKCKGYQE